MTPNEWAKYFRDLASKENEKGEATITVCASLASAADQVEKMSAEIGELQGTIKLLRKDKQMFYEVEKGRAEQAAIDKDFIQQYQREIEQLQASRKRDCVDFFRWFWNQPGTNAEQGYDKWLSLQTVGNRC